MFILLQKLLPQHLLSRIVGWVANSEIGLVKSLFIQFAISRYKVDLSEAEQPDPAAYKSFNAFFTRHLKAGSRPINGSICSPADGAVSAAGPIEEDHIFQAKGIDYSLTRLLGGKDCQSLQNGSFITVYLSPKDYHRVHCPMAGKLLSAQYVPGKLFSVNQATAEAVENLFADNERLVMNFEGDRGQFAVVMVGAMIVAAIQPVWRQTPYPAGKMVEEIFQEPKTFAQGDELGLFQMGSTAIVVTEQRVNWNCQTADTLRMGQALTND